LPSVWREPERGAVSLFAACRRVALCNLEGRLDGKRLEWRTQVLDRFR
jgi:hypothetical protein